MAAVCSSSRKDGDSTLAAGSKIWPLEGRNRCSHGKQSEHPTSFKEGSPISQWRWPRLVGRSSADCGTTLPTRLIVGGMPLLANG
jgi:hypothetical protein